MGNELLIALGTGAGLSVASLSHCALMCGPVAAHTAASRGVGGYLIGRLAGYAVLGTLAGSVGQLLGQLGPARWVEALMSWSIAITLAFAAVRLLWPARAREQLVRLSKKPSAAKTTSMLAHVAGDPLLLGVASALLPCGVLFATVLAAAAQGSPLLGATTMATFSVISGAALFGVAKIATRLSLRASGKRVLGVVLAVGALVLILRPLPTLYANDLPPCHASAHAEAQ